MVDIAKCNRRDCPMKATCFRYIAFPSEVQEYLDIRTIPIEECEYYWRCRNPKELRIMNRLNRAEGDK